LKPAGDCRKLEIIACADTNGNKAVVSCSIGCGDTSGSGSCKLKAD
jgi:hypothetical protein